jgi:hypothetical protein
MQREQALLTPARFVMCMTCSREQFLEYIRKHICNQYLTNDIIFSMPILLRIILQRLLIFVFSILSFFGINPDLSIPAPEVVEERKLVQQERVEEVLQKPKETPQEQKQEAVQEIESKITEIQKEFTQTITPVVESIKETLPTETVFETEQKEFSVKDVVVNITCLEKTNSYTRLSTGSGVVITPSGLVLTNAHVAYPFLKSSQFGDPTYSCSIRRENIPNFGYNAHLVYYPTDWLRDNIEIIKDPAPVGTGENDYALLQITTGIGPTQISTSDLKTNLPITVAGYPGINSGVFEVDTKPGLKIAQTTIADFFTFNTRSYDVLQTGVNEVAKRGSSGGGIFNQNNLYGIVVTTNSNGQGSYINALTIPYIKKDFEEDTGTSFESFIQNSIEVLKSTFDSSYKPKLQSIISS